jgi:hypothetical protein
MDTLYFYTPYDLFCGVIYVVVLLVFAAGPALLDRYWMRLQERRGKVKGGGLGLHSPFSWLSMVTAPLAGVFLFIVRDVLVFLELR